MNDQELKNAGLKVTTPRIKILEILERGPQRHLSAEDIYSTLHETGEEIGLATVYRVLTQFQAANLVTRHHFQDGCSVFELNVGSHHDHLVCVNCGHVEEFCDPTIETRQKAIAQDKGFKMTDHCLNIYGICKECE